LNRFRQFFQAMLAAGVYLPPSQFEALFVSLAHRPEDLQETLSAAAKALAAID
jgi:glutamate-1-semialdehyde 2,1-aminomutase